MNGLLNFTANYDLSFHLEPVEPRLAFAKTQSKITELESVRRTMLKQGRIIGAEITDPLQSATNLRDSIQRGQEKLFQVSIYVTLREALAEDLNKQTQLLEAALAARLFSDRGLPLSSSYRSSVDFAESRGPTISKGNLDSSSAALTFPLPRPTWLTNRGFLYGVNRSSNSLVIIDRFLLINANSIILLSPVLGKSYTAKVEILRQLLKEN